MAPPELRRLRLSVRPGPRAIARHTLCLALAPGRMRTNLRTWLLFLGLLFGLAAPPSVARAASASAPRTGVRGVAARLRAKPTRPVSRKKPVYPRARRDRTAEVRFGK